jgi:hypothetical protein
MPRVFTILTVLAVVGVLALTLPQPTQAASPGKMIQATITDLEAIHASSHNGYIGPGMAIVVQTENGERLRVLLGPTYWVDYQPVKIAVGEVIGLKGKRAANGSDFLVESIVKTLPTGETLVANFRDASGNPLWNKPSGKKEKTKQ